MRRPVPSTDAGLDVEHLAADGGPGQAAHEADLVAGVDRVRLEFGRAEQALEGAGAHGEGLILPSRNPRGAFAAQRGELALEQPDAALAGVERDELAYRLVAHAKRVAREAVALPLLGQEVALGYHKLLLVGVARELYDLHAVKQRAGYGVRRVGGGDEEHVGEVYGYLHIVVAELGVLFDVQRLKQGAGGGRRGSRFRAYLSRRAP